MCSSFRPPHYVVCVQVPRFRVLQAREVGGAKKSSNNDDDKVVPFWPLCLVEAARVLTTQTSPTWSASGVHNRSLLGCSQFLCSRRYVVILVSRKWVVGGSANKFLKDWVHFVAKVEIPEIQTFGV